VISQTVQSSDFVSGPSCAGLCLGFLVVAMKGIVSIDPLVVTLGPGQLKYGTQPKVARLDVRCVGSYVSYTERWC
jgi:hypothetical protein